MNGKFLKQLLKDNNIDIPCNINDNTVIRDIDFINDTTNFETNTFDETLLLSTPDRTDIVHSDNYNILVSEESLLFQIFHIIHKQLKKEQSFERAYTSMLKNMYAGKDIHSILNEYARANGHFIVVLDVSGRIIANSTPVIDSPVWQNAVKLGFCDYDFMQHIKSRSSKSQPGTLDSPSIYYCKNRALYYLSSRIRINNLHVGNVFIIKKTDDFAEGDFKIISTIGRIFSDIIQKERRTLDANSYLYGGILGDLLAGISKSQAMACLKSSGLTFPAKMRVVFLCPLHYLGAKYIDEVLLPTLKSYIANFPYIVMQEGLGIIADEDIIDNSDMIKKFDEFCTSQHLLAGVSDIFSNPIQFPEYYNQAKSVTKLARRLNRNSSVIMFRDWTFYLLVESVEDTSKLKQFVHPALSILKNYDSIKNTNLFETLYAYIKNGFNTSEAADNLYLHRNTFNYRKKKIEELCHINLENQKTRFQLACSYQIYDYLDNVNVS